MAVSEQGGCCRCCFSFIFTLGLTSFFLWLSLRVHKPKFYIKQFYVQSLNKSYHPQNNLSKIINFTLELENRHKEEGIHYGNVNLSFSVMDSSPNSPFFIGNATIAGFYQGHGKDAFKDSFFQEDGVNWTRFLKDGKVDFRVNLFTTVKYKIIFWKTRRYGLVEWAEFEVSDSGQKVNPKGVRLGSDAFPGGRGSGYCALKVLGLLLNLVYLIYTHHFCFLY